MADETTYDGPVGFSDGWHWTIVTDENGDSLGEKLVLDADSGSYRLATDADTESWNELHHKRFATVEPE